MGDPVWIDANVMAHVANGDAAWEAYLIQLRRSGRQLLMPPAANNEYLNGNPLTMKGNKPVHQQAPSASTRVRLEQLQRQLGVQVDMQGSKLSQAQRIDWATQQHVKRPKNQSVPSSLDRISESDSLVLSQVRAGAEARSVKNPVLLTAESKAVVKEAHIYGVTAVNRPPTSNTPPPPQPPKVPAEEPRPAPSRPVNTAALEEAETALARTAQLPPLRVRLASGVRLAAGFVTAFALQLLAGWLKDRLDEWIIRAEIRRLEPQITAEIAKRPRDIIFLQVNDGPAFANVTIVVWKTFVGGVSQGPPQVLLSDVAITARKLDAIGSSPPPPLGWTFPWWQKTTHTYSFPVKVFEDNELEQLETLVQAYIAADLRMRVLPRSSPERALLEEKTKKLREAISEKFGPDVWVLST